MIKLDKPGQDSIKNLHGGIVAFMSGMFTLSHPSCALGEGLRLSRVTDVLNASNRPWNVTVFTDHGFNAASKVVCSDYTLVKAGLLTLSEEGAHKPPTGWSRQRTRPVLCGRTG